ncbi:unnamed protein product [Caenorhabditis sp. 36 PRJEB53466]|nr:unnamed protein product [Caenorhabditis sp. 36 PRJEB53466]
MGNRKRVKKRSKETEQEEASGDGDGKAVYQRPNCCDTLMLGLVCFLIVLVLLLSIPMILTATGSMEIEFLSKKLMTVGSQPA